MKNDRYIRQIALKDFGPAKQQLLSEAAVLVVGVGGLGIPVLQYLTAMGVGTIGMAEQDIIEESNLQRQVLFSETDLGKQKILVAHEKLKAMNVATDFIVHDTFITPANALEIISRYDLVVDASDNFPTRYLVNDACTVLKKPFVYGALHGFEGQVSVFNFQGGPTYRCLFPEPPINDEIPNCNTHGVLGVIPGIVGSLQALEAVKVITGIGEVMSGKLLLYNGLDQSTRKIKFPLIKEHLLRNQLEQHYEFQRCGTEDRISLKELQVLMDTSASLQLIDVRSVAEFEEVAIPIAINVPLARLGKYFEGHLQAKTLYLICQTGVRSDFALRILKPMFPDVAMYSVEGGMEQWRGATTAIKNRDL